MKALQLTPSHKAIRAYYTELDQLDMLNQQGEGAVSPAFANVLRHCARQYNWTLVEQYTMQRRAATIRLDGALLDSFNLVYGYWEAKDIHDNLPKEVRKKFEVGYPQDNILFQAPNRAILWQNGAQMCDQDISRPEALIDVLKAFFEYQPPAYEEWQRAVEEFKLKVPELAAGLLQVIERERRANSAFVTAFRTFAATCREAINPNLSEQAVEEMLIQHLLTERLFSKVFNNPYFLDHNALARNIKRVILALTSRHFSPQDFLKSLNRFYVSIESTAAVIDDFAQKQAFLNTIYEKFFQGYAVKVADTHGIVYTPQPVVRFMVHSIEEILRQEFGKSLSDEGIHILDPFVGTGNFLIHVMRSLKKTALPRKYAQDLHCNEVMLLPYYIASMNIEHEYYELTGQYTPFEGICFVDTFELAEARQLPLFTEENTARVETQKKAPIFVILGNPPYNAGQVNENDNNKNRKYDTLDARVAETYARDSSATNKNALSDVYVKAFRWASDRIAQHGEGIVAFITNNSFIDGFAFDGMRKHLAEDFDALYILDLGGNVRQNPKLSGTTHNVFGIQVGVSVSLLIKKQGPKQTPAKIYYARTDEFWRKEQKYSWLEQKNDYHRIDWQEISPDARNTWLTDGMSAEFDAFLPMGTKKAKRSNTFEIEAIFKLFSNGLKTNRDAWVYNFHREQLAQNISRMIGTYNEQVFKWSRLTPKSKIDTFVLNDESQISWSEGLKNSLKRHVSIDYDECYLRNSLYRPFIKKSLYFEQHLNERRYQFPHIFPTPPTETENRVICVSGVGSNKPFHTLMTAQIPCLDMLEKTQCFPFYTYDEQGQGRQENITEWALAQFRARYAFPLSKWDIFHYVYALLHHPRYRERCAANLKRDLPRIPLAAAADDFRAFVEAGRQLAQLHVHYEDQPEYPLEMIEHPELPLDWRVDRMKLSKDKTQIVYNDFLTLAGIPPEAFAYRLGTRSALDWLLDQYRVKTDRRSGIVSDPNRDDDPDYLVRLIKQVVTVSVETVALIHRLPDLGDVLPSD